MDLLRDPLNLTTRSHRFMRSLLVCLTLVFTGASARAQRVPVARPCDFDEARRRICALDDSLRAALVRADTAALAKLYSDDLLTTNFSGAHSTKPVLLRAIDSGALRFDTLVVHQRTAELRGDTAVVDATMHQVARGAEGAHPLEVRYVRTYVRRGADWQLVRATIRAVARPPN